MQSSTSKCKHELSFPKFHKKELALWNEGNRQEEKVPMKVKGLLLRGEEDLMQGKLLGHKEGSTIMMQIVGWLLMGNPTMICHQEDAAHNVPQTDLQGEDAVAQAIALLHQVKIRTREDIQDTKEGGHQLLHPLLQIHPQRLPHQDPSQRKEAIDVCIPRGSDHVVWKSSKKEAKISLSSLMMAPMVLRIAFLDLSNNSISAFGGEHFEEHSKLRHVAMYFQKSARQWWASLRTRGLAPKTWKECRRAIMKQFLTDEAEDDVLIAWCKVSLWNQAKQFKSM